MTQSLAPISPLCPGVASVTCTVGAPGSSNFVFLYSQSTLAAWEGLSTGARPVQERMITSAPFQTAYFISRRPPKQLALTHSPLPTEPNWRQATIPATIAACTRVQSRLKLLHGDGSLFQPPTGCLSKFAFQTKIWGKLTFIYLHVPDYGEIFWPGRTTTRHHPFLHRTCK